MKKITKRHLQRQEHQPVKSTQPFFTPDSSHLQKAGEMPFFQKQVKTEETEERVQAGQRGGEEEQKEMTPVMRQAQVGEEQDKQQKI